MAESDERPRALLVDGHSVIFSTPELHRLALRNPAQARQELVRRLARYQDSSGVRVVVVFDAAGRRSRPEPQPETPPTEPKVVFADAGCTADDAIERLVRRFHAEVDLTVATRDRAEADVVAGSGAFPISPQGLWDLLASEEKRFQARLDGIRRRS